MIDVRALGGSLTFNLLSGWTLMAAIATPYTINNNPGSGWCPTIPPELRQFALLTDDFVPVPRNTMSGWYTPSKAVCGSSGPVLLAASADMVLKFKDSHRPVVCVTVDAAGRVVNARLGKNSSQPAVDELLIRAARHTRFAPGKPGVTGLMPSDLGKSA